MASLAPEQRFPGAWTAFQELYADSPDQFGQLAELVSRAGRPSFGSVEIFFERSKITYLKKHETLK